MKHLKIKLSVLALACLGAGALALQPTANVKAETTPADCLIMVNGASVYVSPEGAEKDFNGIRWTTKINTTVAAQLLEEYGVENVQFGTLVLPTSMLGDGVLNEADLADALDLEANYDYEAFLEKYAEYQEYAGSEDEDDLKKAEKLFKKVPQTFYSIVSYDALGDNASAAYAMELTARSYVKIGDDYYFASLEDVDTSRSAKQVALATQLAGEFENDTTSYRANKAAAYYGAEEAHVPAVKSVGAINNFVIDLEAVKNQTADEKYLADLKYADMGDITNDDIAEVWVGTEQMTSTIAYTASKTRLRFYILPEMAPPAGEQYVTVFLKDGTIYTFPVIVATKVIKTADELAMFSAKGSYYDFSSKASAWKDYNGTVDGRNYDPYDDVDLGYWRPEQEQGGYYVLGANIDASAYVHGSRIATDYKDVTGEDSPGEFNNATWNGYTWYEGRPIGLTGTFNGMGYTIDSMTLGSQREGFFGIVNGGTVKNVAFDNVKAKGSYNFVIANYLINATIDNVYIATNAYDKNDKVNNPGYAINKGTGILATYAVEDTKISNMFIRLNSQATANTTFGALFGSEHSDQSYTCENVFVYSRTHFQYALETTTTVTDEATGETTEKLAYTVSTLSYCAAMVTVSHATLDGKFTEIEINNGKEKEVTKYTTMTKKGTLYLAENQVVDADAEELKAVQSKISTDLYNLKVIKGVYLYTQSEQGHVTGSWADHNFASFAATGCWTFTESRTDYKRILWKTL